MTDDKKTLAGDFQFRIDAELYSVADRFTGAEILLRPTEARALRDWLNQVLS